MLSYILHWYHADLFGKCGLKLMSTIEKCAINEGVAELSKSTAHFILVVELRHLSSNLPLFGHSYPTCCY